MGLTADISSHETVGIIVRIYRFNRVILVIQTKSMKLLTSQGLLWFVPRFGLGG